MDYMEVLFSSKALKDILEKKYDLRQAKLIKMFEDILLVNRN